jgi:polysaccharide pyruvyl transferase WcaK-like protein
MEKSKKILLAHASMVDINRGCVALTLSTLYLLHRISAKKHVKISVFLSHSGIAEDGVYSIMLNNEKVEYNVLNIRSIKGIRNKIKCLIHLKQYLKSLCLLKHMDLLLNISRGDSYSDIYGTDRFYYTEEILKLSRFLHVPYCFLPQTVGPFEDKRVLEHAKKSLRKSTFVMARDKQSYDYVSVICPKQKNVREYIDVAFFLPYSKTSFDSSYIHVGLNVSAFMLMGGYTGDNQFELVIDYDKLIREIIDYFLTLDKVKLHLIGHVESGERFIESDYVVCRDLFYEYNNPNLVLADFFLGPIEAKNYISGLDFFMGARMHATIAAFSSFVPVVPMAYSRKFNGLFVDTLDYPHIIDMKEDNEIKALKIIKECFTNRELLKKKERKQMDTVVALAGKSLEEDLFSL